MNCLNKIGWAVLALVAMVGCSDHNEGQAVPQSEEPRPMEFMVEDLSLTSRSGFSTAADIDRMWLWIYDKQGAKMYAEKVGAYILNGKLHTTPFLEWGDLKEVQVFALAPGNEEVLKGVFAADGAGVMSLPVASPADQSLKETNADLIHSSRLADESFLRADYESRPIPLRFVHTGMKLEVELQLNNELEEYGPITPEIVKNLAFGNMQLQTKVAFFKNGFEVTQRDVEAQAALTTVIPERIETAADPHKVVYSAIVHGLGAQTLPVTFSIFGRAYSFDLKQLAGVDFVPGSKTRVKLSVSRDRIDFQSITIKDWVEEPTQTPEVIG